VTGGSCPAAVAVPAPPSGAASCVCQRPQGRTNRHLEPPLVEREDSAGAERRPAVAFGPEWRRCPEQTWNMRIWIVMTGEQLPTDGANVRLRRAALLARECAAGGHDVTWWTSTFNHQKKKQRAESDQSVATSDGLKIEMLYAPSYSRNISAGRLINHKLLGNSFVRRIRGEQPPDVILCAWPTIELSAACVAYGSEKGIPVVIDVRDLWPDIFVDVVPPWMRPAVRLAVLPMVRRAQYVFRNCTAITAISPAYLDWALRYAHRDARPADRVYPLGY
jgi:hypothetical protein